MYRTRLFKRNQHVSVTSGLKLLSAITKGMLVDLNRAQEVFSGASRS